MGAPELRDVFERIEAALREEQLPLVVFDLDSTLFSTAPRNLRILQEFVELHAQRFPGLEACAARLGVDQLGWNLEDDLRALGLGDARLLSMLRTFWSERFFHDDYLLSDTPVPGAVEYVEACHQRGALVYYLTGRHVGGMEVGTVRALTRHGFPFWRGRCVLHLKPSAQMQDRAFKDDALADIRSYRGRVVATFENEPGNANLFAGAFPSALHFWLLTIHSPGAEAPCPELIGTSDFLSRADPAPSLTT
jgi:beta-phosphoglucomutase-like phosphatase (HAD superfamily)